MGYRPGVADGQDDPVTRQVADQREHQGNSGRDTADGQRLTPPQVSDALGVEDGDNSQTEHDCHSRDEEAEDRDQQEAVPLIGGDEIAERHGGRACAHPFIPEGLEPDMRGFPHRSGLGLLQLEELGRLEAKRVRDEVGRNALPRGVVLSGDVVVVLAGEPDAVLGSG